MSADKERFVARYGNMDIDKEFSHENPEPNVYAIQRPEATRAHALKLLYHPNADKAVFALSMTGQKTRMIKKSDLANYSGGSEVVQKQIDNLFSYEKMVHSGAPHTSNRKAHFKPFYPEDKE
jgi:uncharacterized lipoprotein NlpE involved in copper resistance